MKAWYFDAVTYDGAIYCIECLPEGVSVNDAEVSPIFANSEWQYVPSCDRCGCEHDYVTLLNSEEEREIEND